MCIRDRSEVMKVVTESVIIFADRDQIYRIALYFDVFLAVQIIHMINNTKSICHFLNVRLKQPMNKYYEQTSLIPSLLVTLRFPDSLH